MFNKQFGDELSPLHFRFQAVVGGFAKVSGCLFGWLMELRVQVGKIIGKMLQQRLGATGIGNEKPIFVIAMRIVDAEFLPVPAKIQPAFARNGVGKTGGRQRGQADNLPQQTARLGVGAQAEKMARAVVHDVVGKGLGHFQAAFWGVESSNRGSLKEGFAVL